MILLIGGVLLGASVGALLRFGTFQWLPSLWALLFVNVFGSFLAGVFAKKLLLSPSPLWTAILLVGFCGTLTTFSTYTLELIQLMERGYFFKMACHFFLNNAACLFVCYIGYSKFSWV